MPLNFDLAPKAYDVVEATPTAAEIEAYARASSDPNPRYAPGPGQVAPLVFAAVPAFVPLIGRPTAMPEGWGYFRLWLNKKVEKPEDFKGLKLGTATVSPVLTVERPSARAPAANDRMAPV